MGACNSKSSKSVSENVENSTNKVTKLGKLLEKFSLAKNYTIINSSSKKIRRKNSGLNCKLRILKIPPSIEVSNLIEQITAYRVASIHPLLIQIYDYAISDDGQLAVIEEESEGKFMKASNFTSGNVSEKVEMLWLMGFALEYLGNLGIMNYYDTKMLRLKQGILRVSYLIQDKKQNTPIEMMQNIFKAMAKKDSKGNVKPKNIEFKDPQNVETFQRIIDGLYPKSEIDTLSIEALLKLIMELERTPNDQYIKILYKEGGKFIGGTVGENRNGIGIQIWENSSIYLGKFNSDKIDGYGIMKWQSGPWKGDEYYGNFLMGKKEGFGIYKSANGDLYEGHYMNDLKEGFGVKYSSSNGYSYKGNWKENLRDGKGQAIAPDGRVQKAIWKEGKKVSVVSGEKGTLALTSSNIGQNGSNPVS